MVDTVLDKFVTLGELARSADVDYRTLRTWMAKSGVPFMKVGPTNLYDRESAEAVLRENLPRYRFTRRRLSHPQEVSDEAHTGCPHCGRASA